MEKSKILRFWGTGMNGKRAEVITDSIVDEQKTDVDAISGRQIQALSIKKGAETPEKARKIDTFDFFIVSYSKRRV